MDYSRFTSYRVPQSPLARFGLMLVGLALLALSFVVGLAFIAVAAGLAILGAIGLTIRNWLTGGRASTHKSDDVLEVEYRVVDRKHD
ncbi:MAG: hypothetical protein AAF446_09145 [Pseudomonadota bacterium]